MQRRPRSSDCTNGAPWRSPSSGTSEAMTEPTYQPPDLMLLGEEHVTRYRESDGEVGYLWNGATALLLTTTGRRSGELRTSPLIFARDGADYLVVASMGGAPQHPQWYLNITAEPDAEIQVRGDRIPVR